jgi:hypothetical protein
MESEGFTKESSSKIYLTNLEDLKSILRGRRLKSLTAHKRTTENDEMESVLKLSEFKVPHRVGRSPLSRKYTFRRSYTNLNHDVKSNQPSPVKLDENPNFVIALQSLVSKEKGKSKDTEQEMIRFTESNKDYEAGLLSRMKKMSQDIEETSEFLTNYKLKIKLAQSERQREAKLYEEKMTEIMSNETNLTLSMHSFKGKKKHPDVSEERQYFIVKEALRTAKRELHAHHIEIIEKSTHELENMNLLLISYQTHKKNCQKELKDLQDSLINFYCMNLKEGMDLREDGIRWTIKSLWKMKQAVPVSAFPRYLDDESSHFLLFMAEKDLESTFLQKRLDQLREEIKKDHMNSGFTKSPKELFDIVQGRLRDIKRRTKALSLDSSEIIQFGKTDENENSVYRYDEIKHLKNQLKNDKESVASLMMEEVKRVVGNYNPETTKNVGITHIIRCLVGDKYKDFRKLARMKTSKKD